MVTCYWCVPGHASPTSGLLAATYCCALAFTTVPHSLSGVRVRQSTKMGKVQAHKRRVTVLTKSATETEARTASAMNTLHGVATKLQSMEAMLAKATAYVAAHVASVRA